MSSIHRNVNHAQRRLALNALLRFSTYGVLIAATAWTLTLLVQRFLAPGVPLDVAAWAAAGLAGAIAIGGTMLRRATPLQAAVTIDRAAGLKERLSTAIALERSNDPFAQAAVADAEQAAGRIHVPSHVPLRAPQMWPWSAAVLCVALLLAFLLKPYYVFAGAKEEPRNERKVPTAEKEALVADVNEQLEKLKSFAEDNPALRDLMKDITPLDIPETIDTPEEIERETVKKLDDVAEKLAEKKAAQELQSLEDTKKMLERLGEKSGADAASSMSNALQQGDFEGAQKALEQMKQELTEAAKKEGDPQAQQQIQQMQQKVDQLAGEMSKLSDTVRMEKELENKANMTPEQAKDLVKKLSQMDPKQAAKELQQQLQKQNLSQQQMQELAQKMQQQMQSQQQTQQLSQTMQQLAQAMQQCQSPGSQGQAAQQDAANAISDAMSQLSQMEMSEQALNELESQLSEMQKMRDQMTQKKSGDKCDKCGQGGCGGDCDGSGQGDQNGDSIGGSGKGAGRGYGYKVGREKADHQMQMTKANTKAGKGQIIGQMLVDGPQLKGEAQTEVRDAVLSAQKEAEEAIERDAVARQHERVVREYFERLAGLLSDGDRKPGADGEKPAGEGAPAKP